MANKMPMTFLYFVSLWGAFTTFFGTFFILIGGRNPNSPADFLPLLWGNVNATLVAGLFAGLILVLLLLTAQIFKVNGHAGTFFKLLWGTVLTYDLWTSYLGNRHFLVLHGADFQQQVILLSATVLVCACPICLSILTSYKGQI